MVSRSVEDDDWDHLDFERDDHLEEFCRERLNRVSTIGTKMGWILWLCGTREFQTDRFRKNRFWKNRFWKDCFWKDWFRKAAILT